jgi:hypothetical protein
MTGSESWINAGKYGSDTLVSDTSGVNIADVYGEATNPHAERHLMMILAAPDLLSACKAYLVAINGEDYGRAVDEAARASELIAAAVAKAEGRA